MCIQLDFQRNNFCLGLKRFHYLLFLGSYIAPGIAHGYL